MEEKNIIEKVLKNVSSLLVSSQDEERSIVHFITTENVDRYGDIVRASGMNDANFSKNPVVLYGHDYNSFPVGKSLWRKAVDQNGVKGVLAKTQFAKTQEGETIYSLWKDGFLNASSIGFQPTKSIPVMENGIATTGNEYIEWELLEYSIVPIPANQDALRLSIQKGKYDEKIIRKVFSNFEVETKKEFDFEKSANEIKSMLQDVIESNKQTQSLLQSLKNENEFTQSISQQLEQIFSLLENTSKANEPSKVKAEQLNEVVANITRDVIGQIKGSKI